MINASFLITYQIKQTIAVVTDIEQVGVSGMTLLRYLFCFEEFNGPFVVVLIILQYIDIVIIGHNFEVGMVNTIPLVNQLLYSKIAIVELKAQGALISLITRMAFYVL
jgi:hypothetical protein